MIEHIHLKAFKRFVYSNLEALLKLIVYGWLFRFLFIPLHYQADWESA